MNGVRSSWTHPWLRSALACAGILAAAAAARAELVSVWAACSGGNLEVISGTSAIYLGGGMSEDTQSFSFGEDETLFVQVNGNGVGDYRLMFTPPPQYTMVIEGDRRLGYSDASASPRPVNQSLRVTMVRREPLPGSAKPLGHASPIAWHPPKTQGMMGPYIDFNAGDALNGQALPPLRIPLFPRWAASAPIAIDLPDSPYLPANGEFELQAPQVTVRLELDPTSAGDFWLRFHAPGTGGACFAAYHFQFPIWPSSWRSLRQATVTKDRSPLGSPCDYQTSISGYFDPSGMVQASPYNTWTIEDWHDPSHTPLRTLIGRRDVAYGSGGSFGQWFVATTLTDTVETRPTATSPEMVAKTSQSYREFDRWLTSDPSDGIQIVIAPHELTEGVGNGNYVTRFFQDPRAPTFNGFENPEGFRRISDASSTMKTEYATWLDSSPVFNPASGTPVALNGGTQTLVTYESSASLADFHLPTAVTRTQGGITLSNTALTYTADPTLKTISAVRRDHASAAGDFVETITKKYRPDTDVAELRDRPYSIQSASGTKQSFAYEITGAGLTVTVLTGAASGGNTVTGLSSALPVDPLQMHPNRSTKMVETFQRGLLVRRELWVYLSGSGMNPVFNSTAPVSWENFEYTSDGQLSRRTASNNVEYATHWTGDQKDWERDETGLETTFGYDAMGRVTSVVREAVGPVLAQATTFDYDAAHRLRYRRVGPVDSSRNPIGEQLVTETQYDRGGRIWRQIAPGGATDGTANAAGVISAYTYANGGRDVIETLPYGIRTTTRFIDGRMKSVSGTAVVTPEAYEYGFDSSQRFQTTIKYSAEINKRPRRIVTDRLGRIVEESVNGVQQPGGVSNPIVTASAYNARGLLASVTTAEIRGTTSLPISAEKVFEYDEFGAIRAIGQNLNGAPGLQEASNDRLSSMDAGFALDANGAWWRVTTSRLFPTNDSSASHATARYERLTGLTATKTAQTDTFDHYNNRSSDDALVIAASKSRRVTRTAIDGTKVVTVSVGSLTTAAQRINDTGTESQNSSWSYDAQGRLAQATDARGVTTRYQYHYGTNQVWKLYEGRNESGSEICSAVMAYDAAGRVVSSTDARGRVTTTAYYPTGQVMDRGGNGARPVHYVYNAFGQLKELWTYRNGTSGNPDKTVWDYDPNTGWLTGKRDAASRSITYAYSNSDSYRLVTRTSARPGLTTTFKYRLDTGELAAVDYSDGTPDLAFTYTRTGQLDTASDTTGTRGFVYDHEQLSAEFFGSWYGNLVLTTLFDDTTAQNTSANLVPGRYAGFALGYVPVVGGVPQTGQIAREMKVAVGHDDFGRSSTFAINHGGQASANFSYGYAPNTAFWQRLVSGNLELQRTLEPARDALSAVVARWNATAIAQYTYHTNDAGERSSTEQRGSLFADYGADAGLTSVAYNYNDSGDLTAATGYLGTSTSQPLPGRDFTFTYDSAGNRRTTGIGTEVVTYSDGSGSAGGNALNQVGRRGTLKSHLSGTAHPSATLTVTDGSVGRPTSGRYWDAALEIWGQFKQTNVAATRNGQTQTLALWSLVRPAQEALRYDEDGNLTDDSLWHYEYDAENRLVRMSTRSTEDLVGLGWSTMPPSRELTFAYDYLGRRVAKIARKNGVVTFNRRFLYDGWNLIAEFELVSGSPILRRSYAWGLDVASSRTAAGGVGALILETIHDGTSRTHYTVASDGTGSVTALINSAGTAAAAYEYDPFGQQLRAEGNSAAETTASIDQPGDNPFRYSSKYYDRETGLIYYGQRYYDPSAGRFITRDPIGEAGGENLYAFVGNHPVNGWDYLGMDDEPSRRPIDPGPLGRTPDMPGEDESLRNRSTVDIRDTAEPLLNWGTDIPGGSSTLIGSNARKRISTMADAEEWYAEPDGIKGWLLRHDIVKDRRAAIAEAKGRWQGAVDADDTSARMKYFAEYLALLLNGPFPLADEIQLAMGSTLPGGSFPLWKVDSRFFAADEAAGVLINGSFIKNPTARYLTEILTENGLVGGTRTSGRLMYVIDIQGNITIGSRSGQRMPHPTLVGGKDPTVIAAGNVEIRGGKIYSIDNVSGHFKPAAESLKAAQESFSKLPESAFHRDFRGYLPYLQR